MGLIFHFRRHSTLKKVLDKTNGSKQKEAFWPIFTCYMRWTYLLPRNEWLYLFSWPRVVGVVCRKEEGFESQFAKKFPFCNNDVISASFVWWWGWLWLGNSSTCASLLWKCDDDVTSNCLTRSTFTLGHRL